MAGAPLTIRLLDPPLHEFLPDGEMEVRGRGGGSAVQLLFCAKSSLPILLGVSVRILVYVCYCTHLYVACCASCTA